MNSFVETADEHRDVEKFLARLAEIRAAVATERQRTGTSAKMSVVCEQGAIVEVRSRPQTDTERAAWLRRLQREIGLTPARVVTPPQTDAQRQRRLQAAQLETEALRRRAARGY